MSDKIRSTHLERKAMVYLRQSSPQQVREHRESTHRQYALRERAAALGWSTDAIEVIDEDLGHSSSEARSGFQHVAEEVAQGRVGALFALEVSRLARSSADWYRLLDLVGLAGAVIVDEDFVYDPSDFNDRLVLGLKGQFADAELYWMRLRLHGGKMSKARRGEIVFASPTGYVWGDDKRLRFDCAFRPSRSPRSVHRDHLDRASRSERSDAGRVMGSTGRWWGPPGVAGWAGSTGGAAVSPPPIGAKRRWDGARATPPGRPVRGGATDP